MSNKDIEAMSDEFLRQEAKRLYASVKNPSEGLKTLYLSWFGPYTTANRIQAETIYKLCIFEKETMGEEAWDK